MSVETFHAAEVARRYDLAIRGEISKLWSDRNYYRRRRTEVAWQRRLDNAADNCSDMIRRLLSIRRFAHGRNRRP